jgi:HTH-type transcriptional regulator, sugar sensing transcriptional regulator
METKILEEIGLTDSEIKVYLALLKLGSSKKGPLVKESKITSSKIYEVVDKLIEKGLASYVIKNKVKHFNASTPLRIKDYIKEKENELKEKEKKFEKILPQLEMMQKFAQSETDAEIYKGWKGMQTIYTELYEILNPNEEYFIFGASKGQDNEKVKSFFTRFNMKRLNKNLKANIIFNKSAKGFIKNVKKNSNIRYLDHNTPSEILIYKDRTAIILLEKEPLVILIKSESISRSFKIYFDTMWEIAKEK